MSVTWRLLVGDVRDQLATLKPESVQCVVTSPPYWGLRDYGTDGQLGLEPTPEEYVANMVAVFREVRRVLRDDGTLWLNLGDSYCTTPRGNREGDVSTSSLTNPQRQEKLWGKHGYRNQQREPRVAKNSGLKHKDLVGVPWRVAFALQADGWWLRSDIIWSKPNPMPESVTDRPTKAHEYLFLLSKSARYFYDSDGCAEPATQVRGGKAHDRVRNVGGRDDGFTRGEGGAGFNLGSLTRNRRTVWTIPTQPFPGAHFAVFPPALVEPCVKAGSAPNDTVLDPFVGSGTTLLVANDHQRNAIGIELNPEYAEMARKRLRARNPLFAREVNA